MNQNQQSNIDPNTGLK